MSRMNEGERQMWQRMNWALLVKVCKREDVGIVSPAETGCMPVGFRTTDLIRVLNREAMKLNGLHALQYLASQLITHKGAGMMDYKGDQITNWIRTHKQHFSDITEDDYERLCSDGVVYINKYRDECWSSAEGIEYLKETYGEEEYEKAFQQYEDGMAWFWLSEY